MNLERYKLLFLRLTNVDFLPLAMRQVERLGYRLESSLRCCAFQGCSNRRFLSQHVVEILLCWADIALKLKAIRLRHLLLDHKVCLGGAFSAIDLSEVTPVLLFHFLLLFTLLLNSFKLELFGGFLSQKFTLLGSLVALTDGEAIVQTDVRGEGPSRPG